MMTRERLLSVAKAIFERDGLDGVSMRVVAREAGLSPMAIYRHFPNKDALIDALMQDGFAAWDAIAAAIDEPDPILWLRRLLDAYLEFALADRHRFDAAFLLPARSARQYPNDFAAGRSPVVRMMVARIDQAQSAGAIDDTPSPAIALTLSAVAQGLVSMERASRFRGELEFRESYAAVVDDCLGRFSTARNRPTSDNGGR